MSGCTRPCFLGEKPALRLPFEVEREERDDGYPKLVSLRSEVHANKCCAPRELDALEAHTSFLLKFGLALAEIGWEPLPSGASLLKTHGKGCASVRWRCSGIGAWMHFLVRTCVRCGSSVFGLCRRPPIQPEMVSIIMAPVCRLTFDLSGPWRTAKPAGTGPLEGRVRRRTGSGATAFFG